MNVDHMLVQLRTDLNGQAYFRVVDLPLYLQGEGADMTPEDARAYARALLLAADECEAFPHSVNCDRLRIYRVAARAAA